MDSPNPQPPNDSTPTMAAASVPFVREQQYVVACAQCKTQGRGAIPDFVESGWVFKDGAEYGQAGVLWFCAGCTMGLTPVAKPTSS